MKFSHVMSCHTIFQISFCNKDCKANWGGGAGGAGYDTVGLIGGRYVLFLLLLLFLPLLALNIINLIFYFIPFGVVQGGRSEVLCRIVLNTL